jgi:uncharacterized membrane protein YedE/YeeE
MAMSGPLYMMGTIDYGTSLALAVLIGIGFGFALERSGFGDARVLVDIFYFRDMRVLRVMFTAILTAMVALIVLSRVGLFDYTMMVNYSLLKTYFWPQLVGGIIFGVGFVVGGYCPGTSVVGIASGKVDAVVFWLSMLVGVGIFASVFDVIEAFYLRSNWGRITWWSVFGVSKELMALIIVILALIAFYAAHLGEKWRPYNKGPSSTTVNE